MSLQPGSGRPAAGGDIGVEASGQTQPNTNQRPQQPFSDNSKLSGIAALRQSLQNPISRSTAGEAVNRYKEAFTKVLVKEGESMQGVKLLTLDGKIRGSALSSILLTRAYEGKVAVSNIILEASAPSLAPTEIQIGASKIELPTLPGDVNSPLYWDKIRAVVRESYGDVEVVYAGGMVIPLEMASEDEIRIRNVIYYADNAVYNTLINASNLATTPFNVNMVTTPTLKVTARRNFAPDPVETATGLPVRADLTVTTSVSENTKGPLESNVAELASVAGYVDLIYVPPEPQQMGQAPSQFHYYANVVATKIEPVTDRITLELQLFAFAQMSILTKNWTWANVFRNRESVQGVDTRDLGAIGFDVPMFAGKTDNIGERIDTKSAAVTDDAFYTMVRNAIRPHPIFSFDIEDTSEMAWLNLIFTAAANGDEQANRAIIAAADRLTNGHFSQEYARLQNPSFFVDNQTLIHFGNYVDRETNRRVDIRTIDYLAMLNLAGHSEMRAALEFAETYDDVSKDPNVRLEKRLRILERVCGQTLRITGKGRRITVASAALECLVQAIYKAGLVINPDNVYNEFSGTSRRGNEAMARMAYVGQGFNQLFSHSQTVGNIGGGLPNQFMWSGR